MQKALPRKLVREDIKGLALSKEMNRRYFGEVAEPVKQSVAVFVELHGQSSASKLGAENMELIRQLDPELTFGIKHRFGALYQRIPLLSRWRGPCSLAVPGVAVVERSS